MNEEYLVLYNYLDELLKLQSRAADMFEHSGVLGTVRENFLVQQITERLDNPLITTGQVIANGKNVGQTDIILRKRGTIDHSLAGQSRISAKDCSVVIEVKSNAKGTDIRDFNIEAGQIKDENPEVICGFFCYKLSCRKQYVLRNVGYKFDADLESFQHDKSLSDKYPNIDFIICIDDSEEFNNEANYMKFFFLHQENQFKNLELRPPFSGLFLSQLNRAS